MHTGLPLALNALQNIPDDTATFSLESMLSSFLDKPAFFNECLIYIRAMKHTLERLKVLTVSSYKHGFNY